MVTLSPLNLSQIEKVTLTSEFDMQLNDNELEIDLSNRNGGLFGGKKNRTGKIEIVITPQDTSEGLKILVESHENVLKRQL